MKGYLTDEEARVRYGEQMFDKMLATGYLDAITVCMKDGVVYTPERDFELAYRAAQGKPIHPEEWD